MSSFKKIYNGRFKTTRDNSKLWLSYVKQIQDDSEGWGEKLTSEDPQDPRTEQGRMLRFSFCLGLTELELRKLAALKTPTDNRPKEVCSLYPEHPERGSLK